LIEKLILDLLKFKTKLRENNSLVKKPNHKDTRITSSNISECYWDWKKIILSFKSDSKFAKKYPKTSKSIVDDAWKITSNIHLTVIGIKNIGDPTYQDIFKHSFKNTIKRIDELYFKLRIYQELLK